MAIITLVLVYLLLRQCSLTSLLWWLLSSWVFDPNSSRLISDCITTSSLSLLLYSCNLLLSASSYCLTEQSRAETYCRQSAGTVTPGIGPRWDPWPYICWMSRPLQWFFFLWGALSDERTGLAFIYAAGLCQRNLSLVRAPWVSRQYFTVSHLRLPFSSPPTTRRVTVEVFDPASTRGLLLSDNSHYFPWSKLFAYWIGNTLSDSLLSCNDPSVVQETYPLISVA
jgi:hypothetical protein